MQNKDAEELLKKYREGTASPAEINRLLNWMQSYQNELQPEIDEDELEAVRLEMRAQLRLDEERRRPSLKRLYPYAAAASILIFLAAGWFFLRPGKTPEQTAQNDPEQLAPVQKGVTLMLANGSTVNLSRKHSGQISAGNGICINQHDSLLRYDGGTATDEGKTNTLTNNGSSKFIVTLADGTEATLDIGSSLTYPVLFNAKTRAVSLTGQAYFKVKHRPGQRFIVKTRDQATEDIGTEFNIQAYNDETTSRTTLLEGRIKVNERELTPGEQAVSNGGDLRVKKANLEEVTAWLTGQLFFHHETLENILKQVARIYNVTIVWQDPALKKLTFGGGVTRGEKLATILNYFRKAGGVDFKVEGKTVTVFKPKQK